MTPTVARENIQEIPLKDLVIHEANPRKEVGDVSELADSIRSSGVLEPLIAVRENGHYAVVAGSRRLAGAKKAGLATVPVVVRDMTAEQVVAAALIENLQREDLSPLEEARAYRGWLQLTGKTQAELAKTVGKAPSTIANALRLLEAPKPVKEALDAGTITAAHARIALELKDAGVVSKLPLKDGVTVDELKQRVDGLNRDYDITGPGAIAKAQTTLAALKEKHPKVTFVWRAVQGYYANDVVSLPKALGRSPAAVAGRIEDRPIHGYAATKRHAEVCDCNALELIAVAGWHGGKRALEFRTDRVCINEVNFKKAVRTAPTRRGKTGAKGAKKLSPAALAKREAEAAKKAAEKEKKDRLEAERRVAREFQMIQAPGKEAAPVLKKIGASLPADAARAVVLLHLTVDGAIYAPREAALAWERIVAMPAKKVAALAATMVAKGIADEFTRGRTYGRDAQLDHLLNGIRAYFGLKVREPKKAKGRS